jgi:hypothetical protein
MKDKTNHRRCLLLNADFSPLRIISWQRAIVWSLKYETDTEYSIEILAHYKDDFIKCSGGQQYPIPAVAKTSHYFDVYKRNINFSRKNLFIRDNFTCQYCGVQYAQNQLTYDHVVPKSRHIGNKKLSTNWTNIVTACVKCNAKKANKTPEEANMALLKEPVQPKYSTLYLPWHKDLITIGISHASYVEWEPFIGHLRNENRH